MDREVEREAFGPNIWLVDEMFRRYREDPASVGDAWREFFEDYRPAVSDERSAVAEDERRAHPVALEDERAPEDATPLRGIAARIAENMQASLGVPTATSVRSIPAKLLEENRRIINRYLAGSRGGKVSFTHIIGWAILRALEARPAMKASFASIDGRPHLVQHKHVNFGLAVDVERSGGRVLLVPNIRHADELDFAAFFAAYEDLIRRVKANDLAPEDFAGTTVTLTNPGTVGTRLSVPRLMPAQGLIVGAGAIAYPSEYEAADPRALAHLGVSKVLTLTSTYDHRVIQGAESGEFLSYIQDLLLGQDRFYDEIYASLKIPYEPVRWSRDRAAIDGEDSELEKQSRVIRLINMYRVRGHLLAELNPIGWEILAHPELDLGYYGLTVWDLDREFLTDGLPGARRRTLRDILDMLRDSYCRATGYEYMHIADPEEKQWIQQRAEGRADEEVSPEDREHILDRLNAAEAFERFLHSKYVGHKRFSLEGAEVLIPMLDCLLERAADSGIIEVVMGMAHRGRLNVLANVVGKPLPTIFREFEGDIDPNTVQGSGDVKYHLGMTGRFTSRGGNDIAVVLASNPSHLEAVDPVVEGMARAKQDLLGSGKDTILPVLLHGDAAFAGQGVVAETLNLSQLPGYGTGGTVHIVVNNNIGFTTTPRAGRSTLYATDIAKMVEAPMIHVNGDEPEACYRAVQLAFEYRQTFKRDIVIDLVCYRRHGHNEADEPAFTQPLMYARIDQRRSVRKIYTENLLNRGLLSLDEAEASFENFRARLQDAFDSTRGASRAPDARALEPAEAAGVLPHIETGVERDRLEVILRRVTSFPPGLEPHPKLRRQLERRAAMLDDDAVDWSAGEAFAFGSLLLEGIPVRLSGQDSRRGTFSQRHSAIIDVRTGAEYEPLNDLSDNQAPLWAYDSLLSEYAALGFEYGYSVANGDALVCWEAQFGDFVNGGQIVIDQFIVAGEDKWGQTSGLVLLLPHGYEGQGPEHSSARLERFLTLAAEDSIQVAQPTTPAQYFHLLRRQVHRTVRKPLIVMTPKSLLRLPAARSHAAELTSGSFRELIVDQGGRDDDDVRSVLMCSGKVAYELAAERDRRGEAAAIIRLEQLYPFPASEIRDLLDRYSGARIVRWVQEEPENMGAWSFVAARLRGPLPGGKSLGHAARHESASPATGSVSVHEQEQRELIERAFV